MTAITLPYSTSLAAGQPERIAEVNANVSAIVAVVNGLLGNDNFPTNPDLALAKLARTGAAKQFIGWDVGTGIWIPRAIVDADLPASKRVKATKSGATSIATAALTAVPFDAEAYDDATPMHDNATNNTRLTAATAGIYLVTGSLVYAAAAGGTIREAIIRKGGATVYGGQQAPPGGGAIRSDVTVAAQVDLAAAEYVELLAYQDSGAGLNVETSNGTTGTVTHFSMVRIGALA